MIKRFVSRFLFLFNFNFVQLYKKKVVVEFGVKIRKSKFEGCNRVCNHTLFTNSFIGKYSYIGESCNFSNTSIGRFCSIGPDVKLIYGTHPLDMISTHPLFYSSRRQCGISWLEKSKSIEFKQTNSGHSLVIGHDVWIGAHSRIIEGVNIGTGAVILAGAVVTKDVPPYAIVGGVPAKIIKYRFSSEEISCLLEFAWWEKSENWLMSNINDFSKIDKLRNHF